MKYENEQSKKNCEIMKAIFKRIYYLITGVVLCTIFGITLINGNVSAAIANVIATIILLDVICSLSEDLFSFLIQMVVIKKNEKKERKKNKKFKDTLYYETKIKNAKYINSKLKFIAKKNGNMLIIKKIEEICKNMNSLLEIVSGGNKESYQVRYLFDMIYPEFLEITESYLNISEQNNANQEDIDKYLFLISKINKYITYAKTTIKDKENIELGKSILLLAQNINTEMNKAFNKEAQS